MDSKYWNDVYRQKDAKDVSWFQDTPQKSLELIDNFNLEASSKIIDIGGGDSTLADHLIARGFSDITVLDISRESLEKLNERLGKNAQKIKTIESDIIHFRPTEHYKLWHDRAAFHFLTELKQIEKYLEIACEALEMGGFLIVSTFAKSGPEKCSGLTISKYSDVELKQLFGKYFENITCFEDTHSTPWGATQDFVYCAFKKIHSE